MKKQFIILSFFLLTYGLVPGQSEGNTRSLLWKVHGKGTQQPSWIFGTMHLLTNTYIDTLPAVKEAFYSSKTVAVELLIDETVQTKIMEASLLKEGTLKQILPDSSYALLDQWFKNEAGIDLTAFDAYNPVAVMTFVMGIAQMKYFPNPPGTMQLDGYFAEEARKGKKELIGLDTIEIQIDALFNSFTTDRQIELLNEFLYSNKSVQEQITLLYDAYLAQDLVKMEELMYGSYTQEEIGVLLDNRNKYWVEQLSTKMNEQSVFLAVGALHLPGENGLIELLRARGFTVEAVKTNH